jgi:hypothetical protein
MHKMAHNVGDFRLSELFDPAPVHHRTRAAADPLNVRPRPANLEIRRGFFSYRAAIEWNNVPAHLKTIPIAGSFKRAYRRTRAALLDQR